MAQSTPATQEQVFEALVDLVCDTLQRHGTEAIRRQAQAVKLMDHGRRLARDDRHPITGETREQYLDAIKRHGGAHPVTGETETDLTPHGTVKPAGK
jgi:hypothetical protein